MGSNLNVICFVTDQQRADHLACYGNPDVKTPNIDGIAKEGILFSESFVANPVCMPNRATMFTGKYPKAHGLRENGLTLSHDEIILPDILRKAGYQTASFGKIHLAPFNIKEQSAKSNSEMYESIEYWKKNDDVPMPFRGFEHLYYVGGHGDYSFGHYKNQLEREHPGMHSKLDRENALEEPRGWASSWKMSIPAELHYNTLIADETIKFLKNRNEKKPFFIWCSFPDPHFPFACPLPYCNQYNPDKITFSPTRRKGELDILPQYIKDTYEDKDSTHHWLGEVYKITDDNYREMLVHTYGMISMVDDNIGRIITALEEKGIKEETIVVFLSDHGELLGDHWLIHKGPFLFKGLVRIPTIWRIPAAARKGIVTDKLISTVDFCPTILDLLGIKPPESIQGKSYKRLLNGEDAEISDCIYIEYDASIYNDERQRQLRTKEWAITYSPGKSYGLLFDLQNDSDELYNLWDNPDYTETKNNLLLKLLEQTSDADNWHPKPDTTA